MIRYPSGVKINNYPGGVTLRLFIIDFIPRRGKPSRVKCCLSCIRLATYLNPKKSKDFIPPIEWLSKKGIIFSTMSGKLETINSPCAFPDADP